MKVKVVKVKDICKYLAKISLVFGVVAVFANFFYSNKNVNSCFAFDSSKFLATLENEILILKKDEDSSKKFQAKDYILSTLNNEFSLFKAVATTDLSNNYVGYNYGKNGYNSKDGENGENNVNGTNTSNSSNSNNSNAQINQQNQFNNSLELQEPQSGINVEIMPSNIIDKSTYEIFGVKLRNESDYNLSAEITDLNTNFDKQNILIFHTHTCESYTQTEQNKYQSTGNYRTTDLNYTVSRVGDELQKYLTNYGYTITHDKTYHDYPAYTGSYNRSLITVQNLLSTTQNTDIVIDLHRDAIGDNTYAPKVKIGDEYCARLMLVIGTDRRSDYLIQTGEKI